MHHANNGIRRARASPHRRYDPRVAAPTIGMLRPALELAWAVAKVGSQARPAVPAPGPLRPLMRFAKLPARALSTVRQVVEEDDGFRARVAEMADESGLGRAGWLWLGRPVGWEADLATLADEAAAAASENKEEKEERTARKRLDAAKQGLARAEAEVDRLRQVTTELIAEVAVERQARRLAEASRDDVVVTRRAATTEQARLEQMVAELKSQVGALNAQVADVTDQLATSTEQRHAALAEIRHLTGELATAGAETGRLDAGREQLRTAVGDAVLRAAVAAQDLGRALADAGRAIVGDETDDGEGTSEGPHPPGPGVMGGEPRRPLEAVAPRRRRPAPLPPAVFDDSVEAASHLVRMSGILLLVDGYNVTLSSWPGLQLGQQRHRLVDALAELAIRVGTSAHVVFDGADGEGRFQPPAAARRKIRVTFSEEGVDADEVIIDLVDRVEPSRPVVVATDDRRVRDEVARRGANVISVAQLLSVLGRTPGSAAG